MRKRQRRSIGRRRHGGGPLRKSVAANIGRMTYCVSRLNIMLRVTNLFGAQRAKEDLQRISVRSSYFGWFLRRRLPMSPDEHPIESRTHSNKVAPLGVHQHLPLVLFVTTPQTKCRVPPNPIQSVRTRSCSQNVCHLEMHSFPLFLFKLLRLDVDIAFLPVPQFKLPPVLRVPQHPSLHLVRRIQIRA